LFLPSVVDTNSGTILLRKKQLFNGMKHELYDTLSVVAQFVFII